MSGYAATNRHDRWKAIAAAVAVNGALGLMILTGLNVRMVSQAVERLKTFDIRLPPPPPPPPPPAARRPQPAKKPQGAPAKAAQPTPVVAPPPRIPAPSPIPAAKVAGTGSASTSGAAAAGNGTGAGGYGSGRGGGGGGTDYSRFTPARLIRNLSRGDYRSITAGMMPVGSADAAIVISSDGRVSACRLIRSSGNPIVDERVCPIIQERLAFRPALDSSGRPIEVRTSFHASWSVGY